MDQNKGINKSAFISNLTKKMDQDIANSFSDQQLSALEDILTCNSSQLHSIDFRNTFRFWNRSYYFVLLGGVDHRTLTRNQIHTIRKMEIIFLVIISTSVALCGLLIAYLLKSALGIDLMPNQSIGLWDWFKRKI